MAKYKALGTPKARNSLFKDINTTRNEIAKFAAMLNETKLNKQQLVVLADIVTETSELSELVSMLKAEVSYLERQLRATSKVTALEVVQPQLDLRDTVVNESGTN
jgi:hypothetical protein